jgi:hypothetical protein
MRIRLESSVSSLFNGLRGKVTYSGWSPEGTLPPVPPGFWRYTQSPIRVMLVSKWLPAMALSQDVGQCQGLVAVVVKL